MYSLKTVQHNITEFLSNAELESIFKKAGLAMCTIKGFACAYYYPDSSLRQMGDIDFIVRKEELEACKEFLLKSGFVRVDDDGDHDFHVSFKKNKQLYEMHEKVTTFVDDAGYIDKYLEDIVENAVVAEFDIGKILIPNAFTHGLVMLLHMQRHMISGGGIGLRHLCDFAVFVNSVDNDEWVNIFEEKLKKVNLWEFAKVLGKVSEQYLHMPAKKWFADADEDLAEQLLCDMIIAGNFGYKDKKRYQELAFVSRDVKHRGKFVGLFNSYINKVYSWNPLFKKHKILLPLGVVVYPIRIAVLIALGKKQLSVSEIYKSGNQRNALYERLFK